MYIHRVEIVNVRGFGNLELDLTRPTGSPAGWTVLAGRNGSGKTTLLRAIALAVASPPIAYILNGSFLNWIRIGQTKAKVSVDLDPTPEDGEFSPSPKIPKSSPYYTTGFTTTLTWEVTQPGEEPDLKVKSAKITGARTGTNTDQDSGLPWTSERGWFLAGYGPHRRLTGLMNPQGLMEGPARLKRLENLFLDDAPLIEGIRWLREIHLRRLEEKPGSAQLYEVILSLLNDDLLPDGVQVEKVDSDGLWVTQHGVRLPLHELSDGHRTTAALVIDIVRHLHRCFGELQTKTVREAGRTYQQILHEGVVLIDEVDLHLHVAWQKQIGFWLKRHFPNIQFLVTTHSPFICQAADPGGLIRLPAPGENRSAEHVSESLYNTVVNGSADDAVLTELFGLETPYSAESERLRERVAQLEALLQSGQAGEQERKEFEELRSRLPRNMSTDVEQALRKLLVKV